MKRLISPRLIPVWLAATFIFYSLFNCVQPYILINKSVVPVYIDAMVNHFWKLFNPDYLVTAKQHGYDKLNYYRIYLPIDFVFPWIYSFLFLSALSFIKGKLFRILAIIVITGGALDYIENISFSIFLSASDNSMAGFVATITMLKTILFCFNGIAGLLTIMVKAILRLIR